MNRPGTISLCLGMVAILTTEFLFGGLVGLVGLVFGIVGLVRVHRGQATRFRAAAAGVVLSGVAFFASVGLVLENATFVSHHETQLWAYDRCLAAAHTATARQVCLTGLEKGLTSK